MRFAMGEKLADQCIHECWISAPNTNLDLGVNLHAFLRVLDDLCAFVSLCEKIRQNVCNQTLNFLIAQRHEGTKGALFVASRETNGHMNQDRF
jgi:hypothetical protein